MTVMVITVSCLASRLLTWRPRMAVIGFSALVADIERIVDGEVKDYEELIKSFMADAYETVIGTSPIFSGYYASNHSIAVRRGGSLKTEGVTLDPETKDSEERGVYEAHRLVAGPGRSRTMLSQLERRCPSTDCGRKQRDVGYSRPNGSHRFSGADRKPTAHGDTLG